MKKCLALSLFILAGISGCGWRKKSSCSKKNEHKVKTSEEKLMAQLDMSLQEEDNISQLVFDDTLGEFAFVEDDTQDLVQASLDIDMPQANSETMELVQDEVFAWAEDETQEARTFKTVYFDYDNSSISKEQQASLDFNIELAKQLLDEHQFFGDETQKPQIVIDGHSCHSAGSRAYNLALSEKRAKIIADKLVAAGIPQETIKVVARGAEFPAVVDGEIVSGDKFQQAPNRRDELRIIYS